MSEDIQKKIVIRQAADRVAKELADKGQIVAGGWAAYVLLSLQGCSELQKTEMRKAYFFGAQHVFASMFQMLDPDSESTAGDERRLELIMLELNKFVEEMKAQPQN